MKIAIDAMGGDFAPEAIVEGTVQAAEEFGFPLVLVGQEERVHEELAKYQTDHLSIEVRHTSQVVDMHDEPAYALRRKKGSSLHVAIDMVKQKEADAAVSAGNTGAAMAIGKLACRMLEGIDRPALATILPNISGLTVLIDVGANVDCKPLHLLQFAAMGHVYAKEVYGIAEPRVGLLSIGEEESKGNVLTKEVFEPLSQSPLNFIGNAEGRDVFSGRVDVVACDGFVGNVVLKVSESLAKTIGQLLKEGFSHNWRTKLGYLLVKSEMDVMKRRLDYQEYGGAPLLGLNGVVIVSHGSSKARAIKNAIRVAAESVNQHLNEHIVETIRECEFDIKSRARATSLWTQLKRSITPDSEKDKKRTEKNREEKKEDAQKISPPEELPEEQSEAPKDAEQEKKPWWHFTHRDEEPEQEEAGSVEEQEALPTLPTEQGMEDDVTPKEDSEVQASTDQDEPKSEKKPWWHLTHRDSEKGDNVSEEQKDISHSEESQPDEQVEEQEDTLSEEFQKSEESKSEKKHWWNLSRKEQGEDIPPQEKEEGKENSEPLPQHDQESEAPAHGGDESEEASTSQEPQENIDLQAEEAATDSSASMTSQPKSSKKSEQKKSR